MESLRSSDHRKIAEFVRELYGLDSVKLISVRIVQRIDSLLGGNSALVVLNDGTFDAATIAFPPSPAEPGPRIIMSGTVFFMKE
jgi:hypothetical protein